MVLHEGDVFHVAEKITVKGELRKTTRTIMTEKKDINYKKFVPLDGLSLKELKHQGLKEGLIVKDFKGITDPELIKPKIEAKRERLQKIWTKNPQFDHEVLEEYPDGEEGRQIYLKVVDDKGELMGYVGQFNYMDAALLAIDLDPLVSLTPKQVDRAQAGVVHKAKQRLDFEMKHALTEEHAPEVRLELFSKQCLWMLEGNEVLFSGKEIYEDSKKSLLQLLTAVGVMHTVCRRWTIDPPIIKIDVHTHREMGVTKAECQELTDHQIDNLMKFLEANGAEKEWFEPRSFGDSMPLPDTPEVQQMRRQIKEWERAMERLKADRESSEEESRTRAQQLKKDAARGDMQARFELAQFHELGQGVMQNPQQAKKLYSLASKQGHAEASEGLKRVTAYLTLQDKFSEDHKTQYDLANQRVEFSFDIPWRWSTQCMNLLDELTKATLLLKIEHDNFADGLFEKGSGRVPDTSSTKKSKVVLPDGRTVWQWAETYKKEWFGINQPMFETTKAVKKYILLRKEPRMGASPTGVRLPAGLHFRVSHVVMTEICCEESEDSGKEVRTLKDQWVQVEDAGWASTLNLSPGGKAAVHAAEGCLEMAEEENARMSLRRTKRMIEDGTDFTGPERLKIKKESKAARESLASARSAYRNAKTAMDHLNLSKACRTHIYAHVRTCTILNAHSYLAQQLYAHTLA